MRTNMLVSIAFISCLAALSCKKDSSGTTVLKVKMTDAPAAYEEVNVDLKAVNIKMASDSANWVSLQTVAGIYNLLELQNGIDTLISETVLPQGNVKEIRLVLGQQNSIKMGGETFPLTVPSGSESGLKIKIDKALRGPVDSVTIDFDAALSVKTEQDGFKLRPVLRIVQ